MPASEILLLAAAAFCTSVITATAGAGGGTALIALMLQIMPPAAAIPVHGCVQLISNATRATLLRQFMVWPIICRFAILMPIGIGIGLLAFQGLPGEIIHLLIGCFILVSLAGRQLKVLQRRDLPLGIFVIAGFITGILNMIVGVIAPILAALMIRSDLTKEQIVATLALFGVIGHGLKIVGFSLIGFRFDEFGLAIAAMVPSAIIGTHAGRALLGLLSERYFSLIFRAVMLILALKLIVLDGLGALLHPRLQTGL